MTNYKERPSSTCFYNAQLLRTGLFADCTVTCKGRSWPAHRNMLSPRCDFFRCCFDGRFSEGQTKVITMDDDDPVAVEGLLHYIYTLDYPEDVYQRLLASQVGVSGVGGGVGVGSGSDSGIEEGDDEDEQEYGGMDAKDEPRGLNTAAYWTFDLLIYTIADKYGLPELRDQASKSLLDKATDIATSPASTSKLPSEPHPKPPYRFRKCIDGFITLIHSLYNNTLDDYLPEPESESDSEPKSLRKQIVNLTAEAITYHIRDPRLSILMADLPSFAVDLVENMGQQKRDEERRLLLLRQRERKDELMLDQTQRVKAGRQRQMRIPMNEESDCDE